MGEDFLRRKNESFIRYRDDVFKSAIEPDLFSDASATECVRIVGTIPEGATPAVGDELWAQRLNHPLEFRHGVEPAAVCDGPDCSALASASLSFIARVEDVQPEDRLVVLRVRCLTENNR
jgi:hypothetical protein